MSFKCNSSVGDFQCRGYGRIYKNAVGLIDSQIKELALKPTRINNKERLHGSKHLTDGANQQRITDTQYKGGYGNNLEPMSSNDRLFSMTSTFKCEPMEGSNSNEEDSINTLSTDNGSDSIAVSAKIENRGRKRTSSFENPNGLRFGYDD